MTPSFPRPFQQLAQRTACPGKEKAKTQGSMQNTKGQKGLSEAKRKRDPRPDIHLSLLGHPPQPPRMHHQRARRASRTPRAARNQAQLVSVLGRTPLKRARQQERKTKQRLPALTYTRHAGDKLHAMPRTTQKHQKYSKTIHVGRCG